MLPDTPEALPPHPGGCGLQTCLVVAMVGCGLLVLGMVILAGLQYFGVR
jgi:hypothetical protein